MKGTIRLATFAHIPVLVHWSFGLLFLWVAYSGWKYHWDMTETLWYALFVLAMFVCVVLHEYGHALMARRFGVKTRDIILSPVGGMARLEQLPEKPRHELLVAVAGPLVNIFIAFALGCIIFLFFPNEIAFWLDETEEIFLLSEHFISSLFFLNIILAVFNMIPAFPMDGGRVLRALLSIKMGRLRATKNAMYLGQFIAIFFIIYAVYFEQYLTGLIGVFVFMMAMYEYQYVKRQEAQREVWQNLYEQNSDNLA